MNSIKPLLYFISLRTVATVLAVGAASWLPVSAANATVASIDSATLSATPASNEIRLPTTITSFTTAQGSASNLAGSASVSAVTGDLDRNYWAIDSVEVPGAASLTNLDVTSGVQSSITSAKFMFGATLSTEGASGGANDIFLIELGGGSDLTVLPLNASGVPIGDFSLSISASNYTFYSLNDLSVSLKINPNSSSPLNQGVDSQYYSFRGVAFDVSDFAGAGTLSGCSGVQITALSPANYDPSVVGYNVGAIVPEPRVFALLTSGFALLLLWRLRRVRCVEHT